MSMDYGTVSVWGGRTANPEEVASFEEYWAEPTPEDLARREKKVRLKQGTYGIDGNKYSLAPQFAALYREDGSLAPVPLPTYQRYLKKRDAHGNRIFFPRPPMEAPKMTSDPCPVKIGARICGKRMLDQDELFMHVWRKHTSRAHFYLSKKQLERVKVSMAMAQGKIEGTIEESDKTIGDESSSAPAEPRIDSRMVELSTMQDEIRAGQNEHRAEMEALGAKPEPLPVQSVHTVRPKPRRHENASTPHTCEKKGRLGVYDDNCARCQELMAKIMEAPTTTLEE